MEISLDAEAEPVLGRGEFIEAKVAQLILKTTDEPKELSAHGVVLGGVPGPTPARVEELDEHEGIGLGLGRSDPRQELLQFLGQQLHSSRYTETRFKPCRVDQSARM